MCTLGNVTEEFMTTVTGYVDAKYEMLCSASLASYLVAVIHVYDRCQRSWSLNEYIKKHSHSKKHKLV